MLCSHYHAKKTQPFNYLPEMAVVSGMSVNLAQSTISIASAGSMVGRFVPGYLSDKERAWIDSKN